MSTRQAPALVLLLLAGGLYAGVALPARRASAVADAELLRVQAEAEPLRRRVAEAEPKRAAEKAWRQARPETDRTVAGLRRLLLESVEGASVSGVRLSVAPLAAPLAARARFAAVGKLSDVVGLSERLIGPRTGVVPERMRFFPAGPELGFELDGVVLGSAR
jgi:hypothetical protein